MAGKVTRWLLRGLALLLVVALAAVTTVYAVSSSRLARRLAIPDEAITIPTDSASIARGAHLASAIGKCTDCHTENLRGQVMDMGPFGVLAARNLTSGKGGTAGWSDADWIRAIRHGVRPDSSVLVFMPSMLGARLNAGDLAAIIAYVRSLPPVDNELPASRMGPIGRMLITLKPGRLIPALGIDHSAPPPPAIPPGPTAEYGRYLTVVGGCVYCHGDDLRGGIKEGPPGTPASADLTPAGPMAKWSAAEFTTALRTGGRPDGTVIDPFMPWRLTRLMTDEEIAAVWAYLRTK
ncbi:MAG: cytochrome c [Gemmatimonadota bacterium]